MPGIKAGIVGSKERRKEISEKQQTRAFHSAIYRRRFTRRIDPMKRNESSAFKFFSLRQNRFRKSRNVRLIIFITIETAVIKRFLICQFEFEKNVTKQCALCAVEFRQIRTRIIVQDFRNFEDFQQLQARSHHEEYACKLCQFPNRVVLSFLDYVYRVKNLPSSLL